MNKLQLLLTLRQHTSLAERRSPLYEQNHTAKVLMRVMECCVLVYLIIIAIPLALAAGDTHRLTPCEFFCGVSPFLLTADYIMRFIGRHTPAQLTKPYSLLPIPKYTCVEAFVLSSLTTPKNLVWMALTVPYVLMTGSLNEGFWVSLGLVLSTQVAVAVNSQWYMLTRSLINKNLIWWLLPTTAYALLYLPLCFGAYDSFTRFFATVGSAFAHWHVVPWTAAVLALAAFVEINKRVQFWLTYTEDSNSKDSPIASTNWLDALNKYGETGCYIELEVKSLMRNKSVRKTFILGMLMVTLLSLLISFTDLYQDSFTRAFWAVYAFIFLGATMLVKVMCAEGNYIDGLMVHKENIMQLLRAKYYFYCAMLLFPLLLMLPTVLTGKYTLLMLLSMACFAAGPVYCFLMQMAVYNRRTLPLNAKFTGKGSLDTDYVTIIVELLVMFVPVALISVMRLFLPDGVTFILMMFVGIAFIATHRLWIRSIYKRFMRRRYCNMESFRASR